MNLSIYQFCTRERTDKPVRHSADRNRRAESSPAGRGFRLDSSADLATQLDRNLLRGRRMSV